MTITISYWRQSFLDPPSLFSPDCLTGFSTVLSYESMHGTAWQHFVAAKIVRYSWRQNREVNPYEQHETCICHLFCELILSLKDMAPNYSKLAQAALFVHEQVLTVIVTRPLLEEDVKESTALGCTIS